MTPPTPTIEEQVAELLDKMANGTVSRLKAKYQFNHSGRQALEMFADDIKANVKVRNKLSLLITKARETEKERYCTTCFNPCIWTNGGHKCVLHGYDGNDLMTAERAAEFKAIKATTQPSYSPAPGTDGYNCPHCGSTNPEHLCTGKA